MHIAILSGNYYFHYVRYLLHVQTSDYFELLRRLNRSKNWMEKMVWRKHFGCDSQNQLPRSYRIYVYMENVKWQAQFCMQEIENVETEHFVKKTNWHTIALFFGTKIKVILPLLDGFNEHVFNLKLKCAQKSREYGLYRYKVFKWVIEVNM